MGNLGETAKICAENCGFPWENCGEKDRNSAGKLEKSVPETLWKKFENWTITKSDNLQEKVELEF